MDRLQLQTFIRWFVLCVHCFPSWSTWADCNHAPPGMKIVDTQKYFLGTQKIFSYNICSLCGVTPRNISEYNAAYCSGFLLGQVFYLDFCIKLWSDDDSKMCHPPQNIILYKLPRAEHRFTACRYGWSSVDCRLKIILKHFKHNVAKIHKILKLSLV